MKRWTIKFVGGLHRREVCEVVDRSLRERYLTISRPSETTWVVETADSEEGLRGALGSLPWGGPGGKAPTRWFLVEPEGGDLSTSVHS